MRATVIYIFAVGFVLFSSCSPVEKTEYHVFQVSTVNALLAEVYEGNWSVGELRGYGNYGIGTVNHLDGELVILDGEFYQITSDGHVHLLPDTARVPFAVITNEHYDTTFRMVNISNYESLMRRIDSTLTNTEVIYVIKITGDFGSLITRSIPKQQKPYRPLTSVVEDQSIFHLTHVTGTMVGFRFPNFMNGVNIAGYHLHFLDLSRTNGGHLLECAADTVTVSIGTIDKFLLSLDPNLNFTPVDNENVEESIQKVEK